MCDTYFAEWLSLPFCVLLSTEMRQMLPQSGGVLSIIEEARKPITRAFHAQVCGCGGWGVLRGM